jgi:large subunit ribosomal protein L34e
MPEKRKRSHTFRKVFKRTPSGRVHTVYLKRKPKSAKCAACKKVLPGTPRERPYKMQRMQKTKKRPERIYGGQYCNTCTRKIIIAKARA